MQDAGLPRQVAGHRGTPHLGGLAQVSLPSHTGGRGYDDVLLHVANHQQAININLNQGCIKIKKS